MQFHPAQSQIASDLHRYRVVNCGRRFGKTTLSIYELIGKAVYKKGRQVCYIAPTYQQARDIAWQELKRSALPVTIDVNESRLQLTIKTVDGGKSTIFLRGWEAIETLRGMFFDFLVLDEVSSYRGFWTGWHEVLRPTLTDRKGEALFISTPKGFNHFYELYNLELGDRDYKSFHFSSYDNPFLPREEIDKAREEITEDRFAQEYLADFRKMQGLVYKEFDRERHIYDSNESIFGQSISGVDFGFTNPAAVLYITKDRSDCFWVTQEFYERGKTDAQIAEYVAAAQFEIVYPDCENPSAISELRKRGVNVREVIKNKDSIKNGIDKVRELFKANKLKIHASCSNLIMELETYSYPDKKDLRNEDENPIKENDHALDALRYAISMSVNTRREAHQSTPSHLPRTESQFQKTNRMNMTSAELDQVQKPKQYIPSHLRR